MKNEQQIKILIDDNVNNNDFIKNPLLNSLVLDQ